MFFVLSKILWYLVTPSTVALIILLAGVALQWTRWKKTGRNLLTFLVLFSVVLLFVPAGEILITNLEARFPRGAELPERVDGIVVLGGMVDPLSSEAREYPVLNEAVERLLVAADLGKRYPDAKIIFSGGSGELIRTEKKEAYFAATLFEWFGIERGRIQFEDQARNTYENALFSYRIAAPKPDETWLLVTSAFHMPRAIGSFRRVGWDVRAYPVHFIHSEVSIGARFGTLDLAVHEYLGLFFYWLTDKTESIFPGPKRPMVGSG